MSPWNHTLTWSYGPKVSIAHAVDQDSDARALRMMIELCEVTIERCNRRISEVTGCAT